jgi:hypothetical protein
MQSADPSLKDRVGRMHRRLLLLQRLFHAPRTPDTADLLDLGDEAADPNLAVAIRELVDELAEQARILTSIPSPIGDWHPGDAPDDERWRGLTEIERREVLAIVSSYENLITWSEEFARRPGLPPQKVHETFEYLRAERARVGRFRQEMGFLERRRVAG